MTAPLVPLRRLSICLDGRRIPLNRAQRSEMQGDIPYWGAGGVLDYVDSSLFDEPLVLLGEDGAPFFDPGKAVAHYIEGPAWVNNHIHVLSPIACDGRFLTYALNAVDYANYITGSTRDKLTQDDLKEILVPRPPLDEQRRIADFLDAETARIDRTLSIRERQEVVVEERTRVAIEGTIASCSSGEPTRLKRLLRARPRYGVLVPRFTDEGVRFIRVNDLLDLDARADNLVRIPDELSAQYPTTVVRDGDVLVSVVGTLGRVAVASAAVRGANVNRAIAVLRPLPEVSRELLAAWIGGIEFERQALIATGTDSAQRTLGMEDMANFSLRWPTDERELRATARTVVEVRQASSALIARLRRQIDLLAERRQALITAAVTGQFDVSTATVASTAPRLEGGATL